jgi:hypothetical protein
MAGDETRRKITDSARRLRSDARDRMGDVRTLFEDGAEDVVAAVDAGKEAFRRNAEKTPLVTDRT